MVIAVWTVTWVVAIAVSAISEIARDVVPAGILIATSLLS